MSVRATLGAETGPADIAAARARAPRAFGPPLWRRALHWGLAIGLFIYLATAFVRLDFFAEGRADILARNLPRFLASVWPPSDGGQWRFIVESIGETIAMAFLATLIAAVLAAPLGFIAARTIIGGAPHFLIRRTLDAFRAVPVLVWALIAVSATGLGAVAGVLAMAASDFAALTKTNAEAIETADRKPVDGAIAAGASPLIVLRYGVVPQVAPVIAGQALYAFESNIRSAAILGVVGAGGIGFALNERIRLYKWDQVAFIIILFLIVVAALDFVSSRIRRRLSGGAPPGG